MARQPCLPLLRLPPERSGPHTRNAVAARNFSTSWMTSSPPIQRHGSRSSSTSEYAPEERRMAETPPACNFPLYADTRLVAQSGRGLVLHLAGPVADRRIVHLRRTTQAAH